VLLDTFHGWPGEADSRRLKIYKDGISEIGIHHYGDDAEITSRTDYTLEEFRARYDSLTLNQQRELGSAVRDALK